MRKRYSIKATALDSKGKVIATGFNDYNKSNPAMKRYAELAGESDQKIYLHAEAKVLLECKRLRKKCYALVVERYDSEGKPKLALPCPSCQVGIKLAGVKLVRFTTEEGFQEYLV